LPAVVAGLDSCRLIISAMCSAFGTVQNPGVNIVPFCFEIIIVHMFQKRAHNIIEP